MCHAVYFSLCLICVHPTLKRVTRADTSKASQGKSESVVDKCTPQQSDIPPSASSSQISSCQSSNAQPSVIKTQAQSTSAAVTDVPSVVSQAAPATATSTSTVTTTSASPSAQTSANTSPHGSTTPSPASSIPTRTGSVSGAGSGGRLRGGKGGKKASTKDVRPAKLTWDSIVDGVLNCSLVNRGQTVDFQFNLCEKPDDIANNLVSV